MQAILRYIREIIHQQISNNYPFSAVTLQVTRGKRDKKTVSQSEGCHTFSFFPQAEREEEQLQTKMRMNRRVLSFCSFDQTQRHVANRKIVGFGVRVGFRSGFRVRGFRPLSL